MTPTAPRTRTVRLGAAIALSAGLIVAPASAEDPAAELRRQWTAQAAAVQSAEIRHVLIRPLSSTLPTRSATDVVTALRRIDDGAPQPEEDGEVAAGRLLNQVREAAFGRPATTTPTEYAWRTLVSNATQSRLEERIGPHRSVLIHDGTNVVATRFRPERAQSVVSTATRSTVHRERAEDFRSLPSDRLAETLEVEPILGEADSVVARGANVEMSVAAEGLIREAVFSDLDGDVRRYVRQFGSIQSAGTTFPRVLIDCRFDDEQNLARLEIRAIAKLHVNRALPKGAFLMAGVQGHEVVDLRSNAKVPSVSRLPKDAENVLRPLGP